MCVYWRCASVSLRVRDVRFTRWNLSGYNTGFSARWKWFTSTDEPSNENLVNRLDFSHFRVEFNRKYLCETIKVIRSTQVVFVIISPEIISLTRRYMSLLVKLQTKTTRSVIPMSKPCGLLFTISLQFKGCCTQKKTT